MGGGGGGVACDANFFVCVLLSFCQLFLQDFAAIMPIIQHGSFYCGVDPLPDAKDSSLHLSDGTLREGV